MAANGLQPFPPYGNLARAYAEQIRSPRPPLDFRDAEDWRSFIGRLVSEINRVLWPSWDYDTGTWVNEDREKMIALTEADFSILDSFGYEPPALAREVHVTGAVAWVGTHEAFFEDEDATLLGARAPLYASTMPAFMAKGFPRRLDKALSAKVGTASMQVKHSLQRPRAYQVALLMGRSHFQWTTGATSMSPSMSSGHSLQGLLMTAGAVDMALSEGIELPEPTIQGLEQFAVDVGDRRVWAGIHYPSDNIASWIVAAHLGSAVLQHARARSLVVNAVLTRSEVWARLSAAEEDHPVLGEALQAARDALSTLGTE
jgi:hypothetical protein